MEILRIEHQKDAHESYPLLHFVATQQILITILLPSLVLWIFPLFVFFK